ncbi:hypothetical protein [Bacteroides sp.]|uniref:hypothetical protein n=1 Tax=Bacteroides sp. TaxID=29523 RepID=UPI0026162C4C|nr:hypothetical protein [Bacteroides sp.]MDD3039092.1 hypothetical protein [Bacteroides sp.]
MTPELKPLDNGRITDTEFRNAYDELISELSVQDILNISGITEIIQEEYNNDIIDIAYLDRSINNPCCICKNPSKGTYDGNYYCESCFDEEFPEDDE